MNGVSINTVKELAGHKSIDMTMRYTHLSLDHKAQAVEILAQRLSVKEPDQFWHRLGTAGHFEEHPEIVEVVNHLYKVS